MKKLIHGSVLCVLLSIYACAGCPGDGEECPHGVWDEATCQCTCEDQTCIHGYWDDPNCNCDCYDNYTGVTCNTFTPTKDFHAEISYNGGTATSFDYDVFDLEFRDGLLDTLWIDAYTNDAEDEYVFLSLFLTDFSDAASGSSYPISGIYAPGYCWSSLVQPSLNPEIYTPIGFTNGSITIDTLAVNFDNDGSNYVHAHFDYSLYLSSGDSVHVVGFCDGAN
jgi:CXCXC repeat